MIYDIKLENILSYKEDTIFSMEGIETNAKEQNYVRLGDYGKCLKTAVIYGPNASGKTNLLRFLGNFVSYLRGNYNWQQEDRVPIYLPFAYDKPYFERPCKFEIRFFLDSLPNLYTYKLRFDKKSILKETLLLDGHELFSRIAGPEQDRYVVEGIETNEPIKKNLSILNRYVTIQHDKISAAARFLCNLIVVVRSDDNDVLENVWRADLDLLRQDESYLQIVKDLLHSIDVSFVDILIPDGENVKVTDIEDYIEKRINYIVNKSKFLVNYIQEGLFDFIPKHVLKSINAYELELLICGRPFIDVKEWKENSIYKGKFSKSSTCVKWFWEEIYKLNQENLRRFLQFSTGSSRVPINGFQNLESNRGELAKYCLNSVPYNKNGNNYIRAHTCFNRLDVPQFKKQKEVHDAIQFVLKNITGFGID